MDVKQDVVSVDVLEAEIQVLAEAFDDRRRGNGDVWVGVDLGLVGPDGAPVALDQHIRPDLIPLWVGGGEAARIGQLVGIEENGLTSIDAETHGRNGQAARSGDPDGNDCDTDVGEHASPVGTVAADDVYRCLKEAHIASGRSCARQPIESKCGTGNDEYSQSSGEYRAATTQAKDDCQGAGGEACHRGQVEAIGERRLGRCLPWGRLAESEN